jgi:tRNA threonylcarbamoyladenosine biosynthesis protein TsaE
MTFDVPTPGDLEAVARYVLERYPHGIVVLLKGELGAGKSTFVKHFAALQAPKSETASPTFSVMHEYGDTIAHYDLYRIGSGEFVARGLFENLEKAGFHFVEWADETIETLLQNCGIDYIAIRITQEKEKRVFDVQTHA